MSKPIIKKLTSALMSALMLGTVSASTVPAPVVSNAAPDAYHDDWLHVNEKAEIVDMNGNPVWLTGVNWFGYNVGSQVFDGAWSANVHDCLDLIADHGFNLLRVPMSTEILLQWKNGEPDPIIKLNEYKNPELTLEGVEGGTPMYSFDIWNQVVKWCRENGIKIMMDIHCATTNSAGHNFPLWYDSSFSEDDWLEALSWFSEYYKDDDTIIAIDLKNEPHGKKDEGSFAKWDGSTDANNWRYGAEKGAKACLDQNPNLLIMVEGIEVYPKFEKGFDWNSNSTDYAHYGDPNYEPYYGAWWGANLRGVKEFPVDLGEHQSQLVYSPHDYGPMVWEQTWFHLEGEKPNFTSYEFDEESMLKEYWYDTWAYLVEENKYPLLMGEWGGWTDDEHDPSGANRHWMTVLRDYMIKKRIHHTFWCFNENSSDTGGLMYDNFQKWDDVKYEFIKPALWQDGNGKFISLDHTIPLGRAGNGITLSDYYNGTVTPPAPKETTTTAPAEITTTASEATKPAVNTTTTTVKQQQTTATTTKSPAKSTTTTATETEPVRTTASTINKADGNIHVYPPTKTEYAIGEELDLTGATVSGSGMSAEGMMWDYFSAPLTEKSFNIDTSEFNNQKAGKYTITVSPKSMPEITSSFEVTVVDKGTTTTKEAESSSLAGDANLDKKVTVADAVAILQFLGNKDKYSLSAEAMANADVYNPGDGVTGKDALAIQMYDAKKYDKLPVTEKA